MTHPFCKNLYKKLTLKMCKNWIEDIEYEMIFFLSISNIKKTDVTTSGVLSSVKNIICLLWFLIWDICWYVISSYVCFVQMSKTTSILCNSKNFGIRNDSENKHK